LSFSFIYNLRNDFLKNHYFTFEDPVYLDNVPLYCVNFVSRSTVVGTKHVARGKIYVEYKNFAIHKIEYATYEIPDDKLLYDIQVEYSRTNDKMFLNYISFNNFFKLRDPRDFKAIDIGYARGANVVVIEVNNFPDSISALDVNNYRFSLDGLKQEIHAVKISPTDKKQIILYLKPNKYFNRWESDSKLLPRFRMHFKGIKDINGRELDRPTYIPINQFRELFAQKINPEGCYSPDNLYVDKEKPLFKNPISSDKEGEYGNWMNTPLKRKQ